MDIWHIIVDEMEPSNWILERYENFMFAVFLSL